jgi:hypothetical protein
VSKKRKKPAGGPREFSREFIPADPDSPDEINLPHQHQRAVVRAEALVTGKRPRPVVAVAAGTKRGSKPGFPYTDAQMDAAMAWGKANLDSSDPDGMALLMMAQEWGRLIKARRRGAQKMSEARTRRLDAIFRAYQKLPPELQGHHTGTPTLKRLRQAVMQELGLRVLSGAVILKDLQQIPLLLQAARKRSEQTPKEKEALLGQTLLEMEAGRQAVALAEARREILRIICNRFLRRG